jgi:hypothetical protein
MNIIFCLLSVSVAFGRIIEDIIPAPLQECYSRHAAEVTSTNEYTIQNNCLQTYLLTTFGHSGFQELDYKAWDWLESLGKKAHLRYKRQSRHNRKRLRREIRTLGVRERNAFFAAINALKQDTVIYTYFKTCYYTI